jgi:hypothetical protein
VNRGDYSRGGKTRGYNQAQDHDMGVTEKYIPCGILDEDSGQLDLNFGSSYKTSDFIVDSLSLTKKAMAEIEMCLLRNPHLPKWDIFIRPC